MDGVEAPAVAPTAQLQAVLRLEAEDVVRPAGVEDHAVALVGLGRAPVQGLVSLQILWDHLWS